MAARHINNTRGSGMRRMDGGVMGGLVNRVANSMTSFDEIAVSVPTSQFDLKSIYPLSVTRDIVATASGGAVEQANGEFAIKTDATGDSEADLRSVERARYIAGYDGLAGIGIRVASEPIGNQEIEWGNTDFVNGLSIGIDKDGMFIRLYSGGAVVETQRRADWLNPRADNLDPMEVNVYRIQYRWYGAGPYRVFVTTVGADGIASMSPLATLNGDVSTGPIVEDPNQPIAIRARNLGTTGNPLDVRVMGRSYFVMGDYQPDRRITGAFRIEQSIGTTFVPVIAFRQKAGAYDTVSVKLAGAELVASGANILWNIRVFSEITGGSWAAPPFTADGVETALEFNVGGTSIDTGGVQVWPGGFVAQGSGNTSGQTFADLPRLDMPSGGAVVLLAARSTSGTATVSSVFRAREEW